MKKGYLTAVFIGISFLLFTWCCQAAYANPIISVVPGAVNLGNIPVGSTSPLKVVTIINKGTSNLSINSIIITGTNASEFGQISDCTVIPTNLSCTVTITFTPAIPSGKKNAVMNINSNDPNRPTVAVKLSGQAPPPKISASPMSVNLGSIPVGSISSPKIVTVKNTGISALVIDSAMIASANASDFSQVSDCTTVPAKGSCTISVTFTPTIPFGKKSAVMSINSTDPKKPTINVKLLGQAPLPKISVSPRSLNLGSVPGGNTSASGIVTIQNTGISDLTVEKITITGTNGNEFSQINDCGAITNGNSCTVAVTLAPTSIGSKNAVMSIASNDPKKPTVNVKLTGKATEGSVNNQSPIVSSLNPNKGSQGQTLDVIITGAHFINATSVNFGADIKVNSFTVESSTQITANITISLSAATGLRNVNVTTPIGTGTGTGSLFEVQAFLPDVTFAFFDDTVNIPSGVIGEVDQSAHWLRVVGVANPSTSRYVYFSSNPVPLTNISTIIFETDISLPTGLRSGILNIDPTGDGAATGGINSDSMGTPILFRIEFTEFTNVEITMLGYIGLVLEQVINNTQPPDEISPNGGLARVVTTISQWTGGPVSFDPLGLIDVGSVGAQFHARLSIDLEQNKVMAEIIPYPGLEKNFKPLPPGSHGAIASPFVAVTNLIDYTKDPSLEGNLHFRIFVRTNGNTDVDDTSAPGGTLRYIDRKFDNVQVSFNKSIEFPAIPQIQLPSDDFNDGTIDPFWDLTPATGLLFKEENGILKLSGTPKDKGTTGSSLLTIYHPRQDINVKIDFRVPTGVQADTLCIFRIQFDPYNYFEIEITTGGYQLVRVIDSQVEAVGGPLPLFGDETTKFHKLTLSYNDSTGHVDAYIDDIKLDGIADRVFSPSFANFQFAFFSFNAEGQYIEREWDNFTFLGEPQ